MRKKVCICDIESAPYWDFGLWRCQYCTGVLQDLDRVRKLIDYNLPVDTPCREAVIEEYLKNQKIILTNIFAYEKEPFEKVKRKVSVSSLE